jgi:hypothetical protein
MSILTLRLAREFISFRKLIHPMTDDDDSREDDVPGSARRRGANRRSTIDGDDAGDAGEGGASPGVNKTMKRPRNDGAAVSRLGAATAANGRDALDRYVVIRAMRLGEDGGVLVIAESEPFKTLEAAIGFSERRAMMVKNSGGLNGGQGVGYGDGYGVGGVGGGSGGRKRRLFDSRAPTYELPLDAQVWHAVGTSRQHTSQADARLMVTKVSSLVGRLVKNGSKKLHVGERGHSAAMHAMGLTDAEAANFARGTEALNNNNATETFGSRDVQIAEGVPFVDAKMFGQCRDPFMIRPNVSKSAFRTLLLRAVGKYLADEREPFPVLPQSEVQLQIANSVPYNVLAIRAPGHAPGDFSMSIDDQGRAFVRADPANPPNADENLGKPFELLCQFPCLVHLQTCRCIYQKNVLYIIAYPRNPKSRSLRLSATDLDLLPGVLPNLRVMTGEASKDAPIVASEPPEHMTKAEDEVLSDMD